MFESEFNKLIGCIFSHFVLVFPDFGNNEIKAPLIYAGKISWLGVGID